MVTQSNKVCTQNSVCDQMIPTKQNGTCHNGFVPVERNHLMCDVKSLTCSCRSGNCQASCTTRKDTTTNHGM
jgi:hypothetical protein